jgi:Flp pilus assembly pilin Flp
MTIIRRRRTRLGRLWAWSRDERGVAALETALILAVFGPVAIWAGGQIGPALHDHDRHLVETVEQAQALLAQLNAKGTAP